MRDVLNDLQANVSDPDPVRRAQAHMRTPLPKRFYEQASVAPAEAGFAVLLDGRPVKTPARRPVVLPTEAAARLVADEFDAQAEVVDPTTMPVTRIVNTAIDGVADDPQAVIEDILRFAASDLMCYRAADPARLVARQAELWDPHVEWAGSTLGARFVLAEGVIHVDQPAGTIAAFSAHLVPFRDPFLAAALHTMVTLTGSAILGLAVAKGAITPQEAWTAAHLDEDWTNEHWGEDHEAMARRAVREKEMMAAAALVAGMRTA
jgi:chaperone required for assembly of F1-ATPase